MTTTEITSESIVIDEGNDKLQENENDSDEIHGKTHEILNAEILAEKNRADNLANENQRLISQNMFRNKKKINK